MSKARFTEHQSIVVIKSFEAGRTVKDVCREPVSSKRPFGLYVLAAVVKVCHVTTTGYSCSLSDKRALHSRMAVLRYET
ncbi:hypothetical protein ACEVL2_004886, partial [Escherichia coli]